MSFHIKTYSTIFLYCLLTLLSSCNGQNSSGTSTKKSKSHVTGKPVTEIAKGIQTIFQDSQNNHWFGGGELGVYKYDGKNLVLFTLKDGLCSNAIIGIQEDKMGNLYFDTTEGICKFDGQKFTTLPVIDNSVSKHEWKLEPDDLWFRMGWDKNGPYRFDGKSLYHLEFPTTDQGDEFYEKYPNASWGPYDIYSQYTDRKGRLWFGTTAAGVCRYDGISVSWLYEKQLTETPSGGDFGIRSIFEDKEGYFWFCNSRYRYEILPGNSEKNGVNYLNYKKEKGIGYSNEKGEIEFPYFMSIAEDNEGDLWMATYDDGVWRNNGKKLIHYPIEDGDTDVLLFSIYKDNQGGLWLGTHNAGVYRFNGEKFDKF